MDGNIDLRGVSDRANLPGLIEAGGIEIVRGMAFCPWHDNRTSRAMSVYMDSKRRWRFKCHGCEAKGDAIDWITRRDGVSLVEAARIIDPSIADDRPGHSKHLPDVPHRTPPAPHVVPREEVWHDAQWQEEVDRLIRLAEAKLWSPLGRDARRWLEARGILEHTARTFRLGFLDHDVFSRKPLPALADGDKPAGRKLWARRGIVLPYIAPGMGHFPDPDPDPEDDGPAGPRWLGANVRRLADPDVFATLPDEPKCQAFKGTARGHGYPHADLLASQAGPPALILEGEWDTLLAWQEAGHLVHPITVGGATTAPQRSALAFLERCDRWILALDDDTAGTDAARRWRDLAPHPPLRARLPRACKDLTDAFRAGSNVADWVRGEMARLNLNPDRKDDAR